MKHTVSEITLDNGAKGLLIHIPDATVMTFDINFRAGEYLSERDKWETAHLMEHILLGANELYPVSRDFQVEMERNGAYCNASTGAYEITYEAECADFEWDRILNLLLVAITKPLFLETEFKAEFGNVREELTARSNNHFRHLSLALRELYGLVAMTDQERLIKMDNVSVHDVTEHYKKTHTSDNMRFVIAGNITTERRLAIEKMLSVIELPRRDGRLALPQENPQSLQKPLYIEQPGVENMYFYIDTFTSRWLRNTEIDALSLANNILTETMHSKIFGRAREKGLVYGMNSSYTRWNDGSNWWFAAQVRPQNAPALFDIIFDQVQLIKHGKISDEDILNAKQYALGQYQRGAQTVNGTASSYTNRFFYDDEVDDWYQVPKRIEAVSKQAIIETVNALLAENIKGFGVLGTCGTQFTDDVFARVKALWQ